MLQRKFQTKLKKKICARQKAKSDNKVTYMAACFGFLKEPDNIYVYSKKKKNKLKSKLNTSHFVSNCSGTVATENKYECRFIDEKNAPFRSLVNRTTGSVN